MRITPLEIRQKTFEKHFRGYDKDEVNGFLLTLSQEWERILDETKEMRIKLEASEREVLKLREVESSLYKTLKTAEDTGANVIEQARQTAELSVRESQVRAEAILNESKMKAKNVIEESDMHAKEILADMEDKLKILVDNYKKLESTRDDLIGELKRLGSDTLDRVERAKNTALQFDADQHLNQVRREVKKAIFPNADFKPSSYIDETIQETKKVVPTPEPAPVPVMVEQPKKVQKSFFDEIA